MILKENEQGKLPVFRVVERGNAFDSGLPIESARVPLVEMPLSIHAIKRVWHLLRGYSPDMCSSGPKFL